MIVAVDFDGTLQVKDEHGKLVSEHHADGTAGNRAAPRSGTRASGGDPVRQDTDRRSTTWYPRERG